MKEKILVFSDSHGSTLVMKALLEEPPEGLSAVFHLGDGAADAERVMRSYPMYAFLGVRGNCDPLTGKHESIITERGGVRFMLTHGHKYAVKSSLGYAAMTAGMQGATVLLYGHTHIADDRVIETSDSTVRAVNPGSVRMGEYAVVTVDDGVVEVELKRYSKTEG